MLAYGVAAGTTWLRQKLFRNKPVSICRVLATRVGHVTEPPKADDRLLFEVSVTRFVNGRIPKDGTDPENSRFIIFLNPAR